MQLERSIACLQGLAIGDAVGKQTETLTQDKISQWYPGRITGFHGELGSVIPRYVGKRYEWRVGETTDDTEQTLAVARVLIAEGAISHRTVGKELLTCRKSNQPAVSLGRFQQRGDPDYVCSEGDGCGAAMRVAPIGIVHSCRDLNSLVEAVFQASIPTHGGQLAICAAAAVAAAVSAAIDGQSREDVLDIAVRAAREGERLRPPSPAGNMAEALRGMYRRLAEASQDLEHILQSKDYYPDRTAVIVPLAISLALVTKSASKTILLAANAGGDADSVASIGGALAAAMCPSSVDGEWYRAVEGLNGHHLVEVAERLHRRRR